MDQKKELRQQTMHNLQMLTEEAYGNLSSKIAQYLYKQHYWNKAKVIGMTISREREVSTFEIIEEAWSQGKQVAVPRADKETNTMTFYLLTSFEELEATFFGLQEPIVELCNPVSPLEIDTLVVPGLAFDCEGYRLGFGGGYYDRYLENFNGTTVALTFPCQIVESIPTEEHDVVIQHVITSEGPLR